MHFLNILGSLLSVASLTQYAAASLRITADNHSFGGVNFPGLQFLKEKDRNDAIRALVKANTRVIRLFIRGDKNNPDPEAEIGVFDQAALDNIDDVLAAIHRISKGRTKVIIAPHDAHALRGSNDVPCDAYCKMIGEAFLDFYSNEEIRGKYKTRLEVFFRHYPSKNFAGRSWSTLKEVIMGVDVQNQPWANVSPIVSGEPWLCEVATHLKEELGLGAHNIAVITGGISGPQSATGSENFPDCAFDCPAVDVIGVHGYYSAENPDEATAGTPWANLFMPGNTLTSRALGKKLLLVEEFSYIMSQAGLNFKKSHIFDQGNALNYRGIPWLYSYITTGDEGTTSKVSITRDRRYAIGGLALALQHASTSRSNFNWSPFLPRATPFTNTTLPQLNPFVPEQSACTLGCPGFLCSGADGCQPDLLCKNSICQDPSESQPGKLGDTCNSKTPCQEHLRCTSGSCAPCIARATIPPTDRRKSPFQSDINAQCVPDSASPFAPVPICTLCSDNPASPSACQGNPCTQASHCDADAYCDWGRCKPCNAAEGGCLGMKCRSNNRCKTGFCNEFGRCDYPGKPKKLRGPGASAGRKGPGWNAGPKGQGSGPNKVRSEAMRVNIPKEGPTATGKA
ncbi:hypothetical protein EJ04DRAFT_536272 [Polyplosphaeria fusca]|uniref:Glycoside hydrolase family 5 protein n=1 Tax=Polyplosphaeria fusca TaxID=682080 RepID=A0A9P4QW54_9PLEO|nr:hypothetical protein EJ04DRAFT_536272 [Polyplosphaeria fusca]